MDIHYIPRDPVKSVPDNYPKPKCDPKKTLIHLPPAANRPFLDEDLSHTFRGTPDSLPKPPRSEPTTSSDEDDDKSFRDDRSSSSSPSLPFARPSPLPYARHAPPASGVTQMRARSPPQASVQLPYVRNEHGCAQTVSPASRGAMSPAARPYVRPAQGAPMPRPAADGRSPYPQRGFAASPAVRGSTIPRGLQSNGICSPAANMGRGNPYAMNKVLRSPPKN